MLAPSDTTLACIVFTRIDSCPAMELKSPLSLNRTRPSRWLALRLLRRQLVRRLRPLEFDQVREVPLIHMPSDLGLTTADASPICTAVPISRDCGYALMDSGNRRRGRDWPDLVVRRDVQLGPRGRLGNEFGRDIAAC